MKTKNLQRILFAFTLLFALTFLSPPMAHADTDGTEIQVLQPERLEIQLGTAWAGVEFQLRTDSGLYPDPIPVGEDGVLRLEIGGSSSYILSCMGLSNAIPMVEPENFGELATVEFPDTTPEAAESDNPVPHKATEAPAEETPSTVQETPHPVKTVAGIPVKHVIFFGAGILICVTVLVGLKLAAVNREDDEDEDFDDYDE